MNIVEKELKIDVSSKDIFVGIVLTLFLLHLQIKTLPSCLQEPIAGYSRERIKMKRATVPGLLQWLPSYTFTSQNCMMVAFVTMVPFIIHVYGTTYHVSHI